MFEMNKETMMMVTIAVTLIATFYLYKEMQKNKLDIQRLSEVPPAPPVFPKPILKKVPAQAAQAAQAPIAATIADEIED
jgi:hypothetical protein